ncbi:MAG: DUF2878 domain-containing protein [Rheinheimera sp.]
MRLPRYSLIYNVVLFQLLWFTAVLGSNQYLFVVALLLALHLIWCTNRRAELFLLLSAAAAGIVCDSIMALAGVYVFASGTQTLPIPWWLIGLWLGFSATLRHSMAPLMKKPVLFTVLSMVAAPLSYLAAAKLGAVEFPLGQLTTAVVVGLYWAVLTPLLIALTRYSERLNQQS